MFPISTHLLCDLPGGRSSSYELYSQTVGGPLWHGSAEREDSVPQSDSGGLLCLSVHVKQPAVSVKRKVNKEGKKVLKTNNTNKVADMIDNL